MEEVKTESGFGNVVVVDNLPKVPSAKVEKLSTVLRKIFGQIGAIREDGLVMPVDDTGTTKGFAFVEYHGAAEAHARASRRTGTSWTRRTCSRRLLRRLRQVRARAGYVRAPKPKPYVPKENTQSYMLDDRGRDQYAIRFGDSTEIHWNAARRRASRLRCTSATSGPSRTCSGRRAGTSSRPYTDKASRCGAAPGSCGSRSSRTTACSSSSFRRASASSRSGSTHDEGRRARRFGQLFRHRAAARSFGRSRAPSPSSPRGGGQRGGLTWPVFKWGGPSEDGAFFARMKKDQISVYEAPAMTLVDKKSITLEGVTEFCWSPADPILSVFQPEQGGGNQPACVADPAPE